MKIMFSLFVLMLLASCSESGSQITTQDSGNLSEADTPADRVIYYHDFKELANTVWQSDDERVKSAFGAQEKDSTLEYKSGEHAITFNDYLYSDGTFSLTHVGI